MTSKIKIVHLEDDPVDAEMVRSQLEPESFVCEIIKVETKDNFISALEKNKIDLILADYSLPAFDGLSALAHAQEICREVPFILVSGMLGEELAIDSMKAGATDYVLKHRLDRLVPSIKRALREAEERTQRIKAEEALKESEERYRNLVDNLDIGVAYINLDMDIIAFNPQLKNWFPSASIDNERKISKCYHFFNDRPGVKECPDCPVLKTYSDGQRHEYAREIVDAGSLKNFRIISSPVRDGSGAITGVIVIMEDITEKIRIDRDKKSLEERLIQTQKMEAIGTLAGGIAHDLNNILSPIMAYTELVLMNLPDKSAHGKYLKEVVKASERAKDLIKQILTFSRQKQQEKRPILISKIIEEVFKLLRPSTPATIEIRQAIEARSEMIYADPTQLHQVIMNLCANASYAMKEKGGTMEVGLKSEFIDQNAAEKFNNLKPGYYLKFSVRDTGSGIDEEIIKHIFEPYFTTKKPGEGTGMGLSVVHGIVKSLLGDITVESRPGEGSIFNVYFPKLEETAPIEKENLNEYRKGNERILLVDDEKTIVNVAQFFLEKLGYRVTATSDSVECLRIFEEDPHAFDLIITDMTMPKISGKELAVKVLSIRADIPVILCTGHSDLIDENKAKELGIKGFIMKPFFMLEMANTIREVLRN